VHVDAPFPGNRLGSIAHLTLDGGDQADIGLYLGLAVQRTVLDVTITRCRLTGLRLRRSQNNVLIGVNIEENGNDAGEMEGAGVELLEGAGNNAFLRVEMNRNGGYQLSVHGAGMQKGTFRAGPSGNGFYNCVLERNLPNTHACLRAGGGRMNAFYRCDFASETAIVLANGRGGGQPAGWRFEACTFAGANTAVFLRGEAARGWILRDCLVENMAAFAPALPPARLSIDATTRVSNVHGWDVERSRHAARLITETSDWQYPPIVLGRHHLWVDPAGQLRIHDRRPTSAFDGRRVCCED